MKDNSLLKKVYLSALFPNIIAVLGGTVNVFFDGIMVGQKLGDVGLESVNQSLPIYLILCTIGSLFASGSANISSVLLGQRNYSKSEKIFKASFTTSALVGIVFCFAAFLLSSQITGILSTASSFELTLIYVRVTLAGGVFKILLYIPFFYLRLEGKNKSSAFAMLVMTVLNIVLDWIFLFPLDMGILGAALASVIATAVACILAFVFLFTGNTNFHFGFALFEKEDLKSAVKYGSPMAFNNVLSSIKILLVNLILKSMSLSGVSAIFSVVNNLNEFTICVQNGVPQTATAMTGIFFGEKDYTSIKKLLKLQIKYGCIISAAMAAAFIAVSPYVNGIFGCSESCIIGTVFLAISIVPATINSILVYFFNTTTRIYLADMIIILRGAVLTTLCCYIFSFSGKFVWIFYPVSELLTLAIYFAIAAYIAKGDISKYSLLDEHFVKNGSQTSFSVDCSPEAICAASANISEFCESNNFTPKQSMAISLAIEEILTIISEKSLNGKGSIDVRVLKSGENAIIRFRSQGKRYNPIEAADESLEYMGVKMIQKMSKNTGYLSALGLNTLIIQI